MPDYGFDTASTVTGSLAQAATSQFGNGFWIRYFSPSPAANVINSSSSNANSEIAAMYNHGAHHLAPVSEPSQSRLATTGSTGSSYGHSDAATFINALKFLYNNVGPVLFPSSGQLNCYLGLESSTPLSGTYWKAWSSYINFAKFTNNSGNDLPFYACLYCNPHSSQPNCSTVSNQGGCYGIWSSEPEPCAQCTERFGTDTGFDAYNCSGFITYLWQYAERGGCLHTCGKTINANVDLDKGHADRNDLGTMFHFNSA